jgi:hypothetical protein
MGGCEALAALGASTTPPVPNPWTSVIQPIVAKPQAGWSRLYTTFGLCGPEMGAAVAPELKSLIAAGDAASIPRIEFLMAFDFGADGFGLLSKLAATSASPILRGDAVYRLAAEARHKDWISGQPDYGVIAPEAQPAWKSFFETQISAARDDNPLYFAWQGAVALADKDALPLLAPKLHSVPMPGYYQQEFLCDAYKLADMASWMSFTGALQPWTTLSAEAQAVLADPTSCNMSSLRAFRSAKVNEPARLRRRFM